MNNQANTEEIMRTFLEALSDPDRLKIAAMLLEQPSTSEEISTRLALPAESVSQHLERLSASGLVIANREQYHLDPVVLSGMAGKVLAQYQDPRSKAEDFEGPEYDRKVLKDFVRTDGTIKSIPSQEKKFLVILRFVLADFEPGRHYPEKEVNIMLHLHHSDVALLRRSLVDYGFMHREKGIYWRTPD